MDPVRVSLYGLYPTTKWRYLARQFVVFFSVLGMFLISLTMISPQQLAEMTAEGPPQPGRLPASPGAAFLVASSVGLAAPAATGPFLAVARLRTLRTTIPVTPITSDEWGKAHADVTRPATTTMPLLGGAVLLFAFVRWISGLALVEIVIETAIMLRLFARKTAERAGSQSTSQP
jgi:hypothetical protein